MQHVSHHPKVGDEIAARDEAEVEVGVIALHSDVQTLTISQRGHRIEVPELGTGHVQRIARPWHVADDEVERRVHAVGDS